MKGTRINTYNIMQDFRYIYEEMKKEALFLYSKGRLEESLDYIITASTFAWWYHFGVWHDEELEVITRRIGMDILNKHINYRSKKNYRSIVFLTTYLTKFGGHTETMKLWIECVRDKFDSIYIVSTETYSKTLFDFEELDLKGVKYINISNHGFINKIKKLVDILIEINPRIVCLFIDPNDAVSVAALSCLKQKGYDFYIIFFNHSSHTFWIGKSIIDTLVDFRPYSLIVSRKLRLFPNTITVIPLSTSIYKKKDQFNEILRIRDFNAVGKTVSVSIGSSWKFVSDGIWDYFKTIERILERNPNHIHLLITTKSKYIEKRFDSLSHAVKSRFKILYGVSDPLPYYNMADFVIDSFPVPGGMTRMEAMALGKPTIFIENKQSRHYSVERKFDIPTEYIYVADNSSTLVKFAENFMKNKNERDLVGNLLEEYFNKNFIPERICDKIKNVLENKNIELSTGYKEMEILNDDEYLLFYDISHRGLINPYLILLKIYLQKGKIHILDYLKVFKNIDFKDIKIALEKLLHKIW